MTNIVAFCVSLILLWSLPARAAAPVFCDEFALPFQGRDASGFPLLDTSVVVQPNQFTQYPVQFIFPPAAVAVGLVGWMHEVPAYVPAGAIQFVLYLDRRGGHGSNSGHHNAIVAGKFANDGTGLPVHENLSQPLNPEGAVTVGAYSTYGAPVTIQLAVPIHICFRSQSELDAFIAAH